MLVFLLFQQTNWFKTIIVKLALLLRKTLKVFILKHIICVCENFIIDSHWIVQKQIELIDFNSLQLLLMFRTSKEKHQY